jgi:hypothetical protein
MSVHAELVYSLWLWVIAGGCLGFALAVGIVHAIRWFFREVSLGRWRR